ncbi:MAG: hypothetical protein ABJ201_20060, partial [Nisaea sp.]
MLKAAIYFLVPILLGSVQVHAQEMPKPAPVQKALDGWSNKEALDFLRNFNVNDLTIGAPAALWYHRYA